MAIPNPIGAKNEVQGAGDIQAAINQERWLTNKKTSSAREVGIQYQLTTTEPENWDIEYVNYFRNIDGQYVTIEDVVAPEWEENTFYEIK